MMTCFMCKGDMEDKLTTFMVDLGNCIVIVKVVPSHICSQCGEVSYSDDVMEQLEKIAQQSKNYALEVSISQYTAE